MRKSRFTEEQMITAIKRQEAGMKTSDLCCEIGISMGTFYKWKAKYGGMDVSQAKKFKSTEEENRRLKQIVADLTLDKQALQWALEKKW
jgi:putative transposase